jgi:phosphatidylglycerol---prolipoprotein diacylglyceryl transferase
MVTFPVDIHLGPIEISSHLILYIIAIYIGMSYYFYLNNKKGDPIKENHRLAIIIAAAFGALIFSRLLAALETPYEFFNPPNLFFYIQGQTIVGALIGGIIAVELTKYILRERKSSGDLFVYPLLLGIIIGRIGCFLTGVTDRTVGIASSLPWALDQGDGILRHPTSIYEIIFLGLLWLFLYQYEKKVNLKNGALFKMFIFSYLLFRFAIEFIKPISPLLLGLSAIQIVSLLGVIYYGYAMISKGIKE